MLNILFNLRRFCTASHGIGGQVVLGVDLLSYIAGVDNHHHVLSSKKKWIVQQIILGKLWTHPDLVRREFGLQILRQWRAQRIK